MRNSIFLLRCRDAVTLTWVAQTHWFISQTWLSANNGKNENNYHKNEIIQIIDESKELKNKTLLINIFPRTDGCAGRTVKINILCHTCQCCRSFRIGMKHVMFQETTAETHDCGHRWNTSQMKHMCQRHFTGTAQPFMDPKLAASGRRRISTQFRSKKLSLSHTSQLSTL